MHLGRYQLGDFIPLLVLTRDASDTPTVPDDCPQVHIYSPAGTKVTAKLLPVLDRYGQTGLFGMPLQLDEGFAAGHYTVVYTFLVGSYNGMVEDTFEVVAGGSADGMVIAACSYERPHGKFLVEQLDSGRVFAGRNPKI